MLGRELETYPTPQKKGGNLKEVCLIFSLKKMNTYRK